MEWATQGEQVGPADGHDPYGTAPPSFEPPPSPPPAADTVAMNALPATPAPLTQAPLTTGATEQCQTCAAHIAADQRYCLNCGQRRGDPRLPFMDASAFMETSMQRRRPPTPPPPPPKKSRMSPNASLIAGVGTLLLAMGIGVLIGRSGDHSGSTATAPPVQVVTAPTAGATTGAVAKTASTAGSGGGSKATKVKVPKSTNANKQAASSVLKPKDGIKLPPATVKPGDPGKGPGYTNGKFTGDFFGK